MTSRSCRVSHASSRASSHFFSARRTDSSDITFDIPSSSAHAVSFLILSMWQYRRNPASIASTIVPTTSRTFGAFGLAYSNGASSTSLSNIRLTLRNVAKYDRPPHRVTFASSSQRMPSGPPNAAMSRLPPSCGTDGFVP